MKPSVQAALGLSALAAGVSKSPTLIAALVAIHSPYSAGYATGVAALLLLLSLAGARVLTRGLSRLAGAQGGIRAHAPEW